MRVARVIERLPPAPGGEEIHGAELSRALAGLDVRQTVISRVGGPLGAGISQRVAQRGVSGAGRFDLLRFCAWAAVRLHEEHRRERFDLVHVHGDYPEAVMAAIVSLRLDVPAVMTIHAGFAEGAWQDVVRRGAFSAMERVWSVSSAAAADIRSTGASPRVFISPSGVRGAFFEQPTVECRDGPVICVGRLAPLKGLEFLLKAHDMLEPSLGRRWIVAAGGTGKYADRMRAEIGGRPSMTQVEEADPRRLAQLVASAAVFVLPSVDSGGVREGVPTAVLEAIATGTPVVATASGGTADILDHGAGGLVVEPGDARALASGIRRTLDDPKAAEARAEHARRTGWVRTWPEVARSAQDIYRSSVEEHARPSVAFVIPWLATGGAEVVLVGLANAIAARGVRTAVAAAPGALVDRLDPSVEFAPLRRGRSPTAIVVNAVALAGLFVRLQPVAVNSHSFVTGIASRLGAALARVRTRHLLTLHNGAQTYSPVVGAVGSLLFARVLPVTDVVAEELRRWAPPWRRRRFSVVHTGLPLSEAPAAAPASRIVGVVARLVRLKGHDVLLRAWAGVAADPEAQGWTLEVWGEGPERTPLEALTRDLGIADRVFFRGTVEGAADRMHELAMVVLPSRREGLPLALIEAMAAGLAVVASDLPGCREVLGPDAGVLTRPGDPDALRAALLALMADEERRLALGAAGRRRAVEAFSLERMVHTYSRELGVADEEASSD